LGLGNHPRAPAVEVFEVGERVQKMRAVHFLDALGVEWGVHAIGLVG
jgi:hypothetical protein